MKPTYTFASDLPAIQALLGNCDLSAEGIEPLLANCLTARMDSRIVGMITLEVGSRSALLRSLAAIDKPESLLKVGIMKLGYHTAASVAWGRNPQP